MLISHNPPFLFLHVDKAAGSSIQMALQPYANKRLHNRLRRRLVWLGSVNRLLRLYNVLEFPEHVSATVVKNCLPRQTYSAMFKFAFVRNPWDRMVSKYTHLLQRNEHPRHKKVKAFSGFTEFLEWDLQRDNAFQYTYVCDSKGELIVDFIGYFERVQEDFQKVCARLKVQAPLPSRNKSSHADYRTYYTPATRELVARHFKHDIEFFGYDFDGIAGPGKPGQLKTAA